MRLPKHLSVSSVALYARCPAQWRSRYVDKTAELPTPAMTFGAAMARALEALHREQDADLVWVRAHAAVRPNITPGVEHGLRLLNRYRELGPFRGRPEQKFRLHLPNRQLVPVPILGFMDLMTDDEVIEFKTSRATWTQQRVDTEHQAAVYAWAFQQLTKRRPSCVRYVVMSTVRDTLTVLETRPTGDDLWLFEQQAAATWNGIVAGAFDGCGKCRLCRPTVVGTSDDMEFV